MKPDTPISTLKALVQSANWRGTDRTAAAARSIEQSMRLAASRGMKRVDFVLLGMRIPRAKAFYEKLIQDDPSLAEIEVEFIPAEDLLRERYKDHPHALQNFNEVFTEFEDSESYKRTAGKEAAGVEALKRDDYKGKGQY